MFTSNFANSARMLAARVGHETVCLAIAALFCVVEGAVKVTELVTALQFRRVLPPPNSARVPPSTNRLRAI